jgi:hypothetical protein
LVKACFASQFSTYLLQRVKFFGPATVTSLARIREDAMNHTMYSADGGTHLKIVVIGLVCAILVAGIGIFAHVGTVDLGTAALVKASQPTTLSGRLPTIR